MSYPDGDGRPFPLIEGRAAIRRAIPPALEKGRSVHQVHSPEIAITAPAAATGIWGLHDVFHSPGFRMEAYGFYHERYRKVGETWLIAALHLRWLTSTRTHMGETGPMLDD